MKIHFYLRYSTRFGENLTIQLQNRTYSMEYLNQDFWHFEWETEGPVQPGASISYQYHLHQPDEHPIPDWDADRSISSALLQSKDQLFIVDTWSNAGAFEHAFSTQPFQTIYFRNKTPLKTTKLPSKFTHEFRVKAPLLQSGESVCLLGAGQALHDWSTTQPIHLQKQGDWWVTRVDLSKEDFPIPYKYGIWSQAGQQLVRFESGDNRTLYFPGERSAKVLLHDGFLRMPNDTFRGAGVAIPVFSLRTEKSYGTGEFTDLKQLADWAVRTGLKLIQLLPVNDTSATGTWTDSYPYAAVSAFALHPLYLNVSEVAGKKHASLLKSFQKDQKKLNSLSEVDYEAVMKAKRAALELLYEAMGPSTLTDAYFLAYLEENKHWLEPYAVFTWLKEQNGTSDFNQWKQHSVYQAEEIQALANPSHPAYPAIAFHYFVQWHLHLQLRSAVEYAHSKGLAIKGDIPIGIYRYSCDAWVAPELYQMDRQAGAPPDDFAEKGQNWGFPTYNWERMKADGFAWWKQRFAQMSFYFDAFRIDHILGFFRIWSIPIDAVEGILGQFIPAIALTEQEFWQLGIGFNRERLCKPYITDAVLHELFRENQEHVYPFLQKNDPTGRYELRPEFNTQQKVQQWANRQPASARTESLRQGLLDLIANVILLEDPQGGMHFRFGIDKTSSFQHLDHSTQHKLNQLYVDYFFRRQDQFWKKEALEKLPALRQATQMLICGEDLGMVPNCVPEVMEGLGILSLEVQRMPKKAGYTFFHPKDAPYLSVVTPSTHDMSTIRGWWEEDRATTQRFYNEQLQRHGEAPWFCEPWINRAIIEQHLYSPAMWSIFQLQDLMGSDGELRRTNPQEERINVPANPKHYWQYRMHLTLEALLEQNRFNQDLNDLILKSGRA